MNYSNGWAMAFNTPYKLFKRFASHEGGIADPCIVSWPGELSARGVVNDHYVHVSDVTPTVYELLDIDPPQLVKGVAQKPLEGVSFAAALHDPASGRRKHTQFYSMMGTRGIWHDGWFANTVHPPTTAAPRGWSNFTQDRWELFHIDSDRSQAHDLAAEHPDRLTELKTLWHEKALEYHGYPLNDLSVAELVMRGISLAGSPAQVAEFYPATPASQTPITGLIRGRGFTVRAPVTVEAPDADGVVFSQGSRTGGHALFLKAGRLHYVVNVAGAEQRTVTSAVVPVGRHVFGARFTPTGGVEGRLEVVGEVELTVDDQVLGSCARVRMAALDPMQPVTAGRSVAYSVSADYRSPSPLHGATVDHVRLDIDRGGDTSGGAVAGAAFARD